VLFLHRLQPGGADRSYGIEVGRLAGLPSTVLGRARSILRLLEGGHLVSAVVPSGLRSAEEQLPLFSASAPHPVVERLRQLDVDNLTPLQALQLLAELRTVVKTETSA
jgi:DNA mismatch repair protein MutS